jgi:hypothetical protein
MPYNVNLSGGIINSLLASAAVTALVPSLSIHAGLMPEEARVPFLLVEVEETETFWWTEGSRYEQYRAWVTAYAPAAAPPALKTDPPPAAPADLILDACEDALDFEEVIPSENGVTLISVVAGTRQREMAKQRDARVRRVQSAWMYWDVRLGNDI